MGNMVNTSGTFYSSGAGFSTMPTDYYDAYSYNTSNTTHARGKLGDATKETKGWYQDYSSFIINMSPWFVRGGIVGKGTDSGIFGFHTSHGHASIYYSFRPVLIQK